MSAKATFKAANTSNQPADIDAIHIFLDLDGVIADFDTHVTTHGKRLANNWVNYKALDTEWWETMPEYEHARDFYAQLRFRAPVKFLTATPPSNGEPGYSGKAKWIMNFAERGYHALKDLIICPRGDKCLLAGPKRVLIDDKAENIAEWVAAGGIGIHHKGDYADTLRRLDVELARLKAAASPSSPGQAPAGP